MWGTILRDFLKFWTWQRQKQNKSARLPQILNLTTSKTKQFCETSFKYGKLSAELTALVPMRFAIFPLHLSKVWRLPRKSDARSYKVLHLSRKIIFPKLKIWCSKMQTPLRKSAPGPPNSSDEHVSSTAPATRNAFCQILCICPMPASVFEIATNPSRFAHFWQGAQSLAPATRNDIWTSKSVPKQSLSFTLLTLKCASRHNGVHFFDISTSKSGPNLVCFAHFDFEMCFAPQRRALFRHRNFWKVLRSWGVLYILTSTRASRHNSVHFFDISTSKSGPNLVCFAHFDFEMCFAPQRRALFRHRNFWKCSGAEVFCTFWLRHVLRATTACTFSTSQLPKVVRCWGVLYSLTGKSASCYNGVQFFISHLASWLRTRRFSKPTFRPSGATNHWKNTVFRDFPTFSRTWIFFPRRLSLFDILSYSFFFSSLLFSSLLFSSLLGLFPSLLLICPYCRKFDF